MARSIIEKKVTRGVRDISNILGDSFEEAMDNAEKFLEDIVSSDSKKSESLLEKFEKKIDKLVGNLPDDNKVVETFLEKANEFVEKAKEAVEIKKKTPLEKLSDNIIRPLKELFKEFKKAMNNLAEDIVKSFGLKDNDKRHLQKSRAGTKESHEVKKLKIDDKSSKQYKKTADKMKAKYGFSDADHQSKTPSEVPNAKPYMSKSMKGKV